MAIRSPFKIKLDVVANVVFIVIALLFAGVLVQDQLVAARAEPLLRPGDTLPNPAGYDWSAHDRTLVFALQSTCRYCEESAPFYRRLLALQQTGETSAHFLAVFPETEDAVRNLLAAKRLPLDYRSGVLFSSLNISSTPTLVLVSSSGRVLHIWDGQLTSEAEEHLVDMLRAPRRPPV